MAKGLTEGNYSSSSSSSKQSGGADFSGSSFLVLSTNKREQGKSMPSEVVAIDTVFPGMPTHLDPSDGLGSHFPNPKVVEILKRLALEEKYLLPSDYKLGIPNPNATINRLPYGASLCIT